MNREDNERVEALEKTVVALLNRVGGLARATDQAQQHRMGLWGETGGIRTKIHDLRAILIAAGLANAECGKTETAADAKCLVQRITALMDHLGVEYVHPPQRWVLRGTKGAKAPLTEPLRDALKGAIDSLEYVDRAHPDQVTGIATRQERIARCRVALAMLEDSP